MGAKVVTGEDESCGWGDQGEKTQEGTGMSEMTRASEIEWLMGCAAVEGRGPLWWEQSVGIRYCSPSVFSRVILVTGDS